MINNTDKNIRKRTKSYKDQFVAKELHETDNKKATVISTWLSSIKQESASIELVPAKVWITAALISFLLFSIYAVSASWYPTGYVYSDELMATAYDLGLSRPPGQPLYILILHFFINLPLPVSVALRGHLLSALFQSIAACFIFVSSWIVISHLKTLTKQKNNLFSQQLDHLFAAGASTILIGISPLMWSYGSVAEKPAFVNSLIALLVFYTVKVFYFRQQRLIDLVILFGALGLGIGNYPPIAFFIPIVLFAVLYRHKLTRSAVYKLAVAFISLLSFNVVLIFALSYSNSVMSWSFDRSLMGFWEYLTNNSFHQNTLLYQFGRKIPETFPVYILNMTKYLGWIPLLLTVLGIRLAWTRSKKTFIFILCTTLLAGLVYLLLLNWSDERLAQILILRQYSMVLWLFVIPTAMAIDFLLQRSTMAFLVLSDKKKAWHTFVVGAVSLWLLLSIWNKSDIFNADKLAIFGNIHRDALSKTAPNSLLVCINDISCASLLYHQQVLGVRRDVEILTTQYPLVSRKLETKGLSRFDYSTYPYIGFDYITWTLGKRPVYMLGLTQQYYDVLGLPFGFNYYVPGEYIGELRRSLPDKVVPNSYPLSAQLREQLYGANDQVLDFHKESIGQLHMFNALTYQNMGQSDITREELNVSTNLLYEIDDIPDKKIESYRSTIETQSPNVAWKLAHAPQNIDDILATAKLFLAKNQLNKAFPGALGAVSVDPNHIGARLLLALSYEKRESFDAARVEYNNVLKLDPGNVQAIDALESLKNK